MSDRYTKVRRMVLFCLSALICCLFSFAVTAAAAGKSGLELLDCEKSDKNLAVKLSTDQGKTDYSEGESLVFKISAETDCYATVLLVSSDGGFILLFPNQWNKTGKLLKGQPDFVPALETGIRFPVTPPPGEIVIKAIATERPILSKQLSTELENRAFAVNGKLSSSPADNEKISRTITGGPLAPILSSMKWSTTTLVIQTLPMPTYETTANEKLLKRWEELTKIQTKSIGPFEFKRPRVAEKVPYADDFIIYYKTKTSGTKSIGAADVPYSGSIQSPLSAMGTKKAGAGTKAIGEIDLEKEMKQLQNDPNVKAVIPNYRRYLFGSNVSSRLREVQWALKNDFSAKYDTEWYKVQKEVESIEPPLIAVVDQGMIVTDERIRKYTWVNEKEKPGNNVDDDQNGLIDDIYGYNFFQLDDTWFYNSVDGSHGSFVSSIIAGRNTAATNDVIGLAPKATIINCVAMGEEGFGSDLSIFMAMQYAVDKGAKIINLSLGSEVPQSHFDNYVKAHKEFYDFLEEQGVILVCAAGNAYNNNDMIPSIPANLPWQNVISVMAIDADGAPARFRDLDGSWYIYSNYGYKTVHIAAPGSLMLGIHEKDKQMLNNGTSFAAPVVTAACALVWGKHPDWDYKMVIRAVLETAKKSPHLKGKCQTEGILDLEAALKWTP